MLFHVHLASFFNLSCLYLANAAWKLLGASFTGSWICCTWNAWVSLNCWILSNVWSWKWWSEFLYLGWYRSSCNLVVVNLEYFGSRTVCIDSKYSTRIDHEIIFWIDCDAWKDKGYAVLMKWNSLSFPCQRITFVKYFWHQKWWTTNTPHPAQHPRLGPLPRPCVLQSVGVWSNLRHKMR